MKEQINLNDNYSQLCKLSDSMSEHAILIDDDYVTWSRECMDPKTIGMPLHMLDVYSTVDEDINVNVDEEDSDFNEMDAN